MHPSKLNLVLLPTLPTVIAWGSLGHTTIAYTATNFLTSTTSTHLQHLLNDTTPHYLANVATWADSYRYTAAGRWTAPLHFIDAEDTPPSPCNVTYRRDCGSQGCIISAIQNYTSRLSNTTLITSERIQAAKFLIHFLGDIHQPLHDEAIEKGGNGLNVTFDGKVSNLHAVWDTAIPERKVGGYSLDHAALWAGNLSTAILEGGYASEAESWLDGSDIVDPIGSSLIWAGQANRLVCTTVLKGGRSAVEGMEMNGSYYEEAIGVVELQIARAGYRLAAWLNSILDQQEERQYELR